jgi:hypothetical protein
MKKPDSGWNRLSRVGVLTFVVCAGPAASGQIVQLGSPLDVSKLQNIATGPAPRHRDGTIRLDAPSGAPGLWFPFHGVAERLVNPDDMDPKAAADYPHQPRLGDVPFQPWARALYLDRRTNPFEPHSRCKPSFGPRQLLTPYGVEFLDLRSERRLLIVDLGGPHTYRTVYMDGRPHPEESPNDYYGHSVGRWEGDTLVVDSRGFNEGFWMDRSGLPHTRELHTIERFTRTDSRTIRYSVTIDDPGAYTRPWTTGFDLGWAPGEELFEYICQENNLAGDLLVGAQTSVDRRALTVP